MWLLVSELLRAAIDWDQDLALYVDGLAVKLLVSSVR